MYSQHNTFMRAYQPSAGVMWLGLSALLVGCSGGMTPPLTISPQQASVRIGSTLTLSADQMGIPVNAALWAVAGGNVNGSISLEGVYSPPQAIPSSNVTITCQAKGQTAAATVTVLNPQPVVNQLTPTTLIELSTPVTVIGSGFVSGSQIVVGGSVVPTTFIDGNRLSATILVSSTTVTSVTVAVSNPSPGAVVGSPISVPVAIAPLTISPQSASIRLGSTIALNGMQLGADVSGGVWSVVGGSINGSITAGGVYTPPSSIPPASVAVTYQALGQTATSTLTVVNPVPTISQITPAKLTELSTPVVLAGSGFVVGSQILINGTSIPTAVVDGSHLSATVPVSSISVTSLTVTVSNPNPGAISSSRVDLPVAVSPLSISPSSASVRLGNTLKLSGTQEGAIVGGGVWTIAGGSINGTIGSDGTYTPPFLVPTSDVTVSYAALGQIATSTVSVLNPMPTVTQFTPSTLVQLSTSVTVTGSGFVSGSQIISNGTAIATTFVDSHHLSGVITASSTSVTSIAVSVANPSPGPIVSSSIAIPVAIAPLTISPQGPTVRLGNTLTLSGLQQGSSVTGGIWSVTGGPANGSISANGVYTPPPSIPLSSINISYQALGQTATTAVTVLNPIPVLSLVSPAQLHELSTAITLTGAGFVNGSRILIDGAPIATTLIDDTHLSGTVSLKDISASSITVAVSNPNPGAVKSGPTSLSVAIPRLAISPEKASVRVGGTLALSAEQLGASVNGAIWSVTGGLINGSIDANGVYTAPPIIPASSVTVSCQALGQTATTAITVLNPLPVVSQVAPATITQLSTSMTVTGSGFITGSQLFADGVSVPTTFIDNNHLAASVIVSSNTINSLTLTVENPNPGAVTSIPYPIPVAIAPLRVFPLVLSGGNVAITASIPGLPVGSVVTLDGVPLATSPSDAQSITGTGYLPFWRSGTVTVAVASTSGSAPFAQLQVPISTTAVSYDTAARFAMQAGFGPRHDIIEHIQQVGLSQFVDEQLRVPPDTYTTTNSPPHNFLLNVVNNNTQLRLRTAWAFQSFIPEQGIFRQQSMLPWEETLEAHAFSNFRQILLDAASDPNVTTLLNLPGTSVSTDPNVHPNQNFARELLQLFSIGTVMLNDDGTVQADEFGNPIPAYDQDTILAMSRALTGWTYAPTVNPAYSFYGIDYTQKLVPIESHHDTGAKVIFGSLLLPAGQTTTEDRDQVLDAVFQHQNVPPFISRRLIQRFVKSQPSPGYVERISGVFKDDGKGVRGNLAAVIKAILLDPEARAGDSMPLEDDGFVQDPLFAELFAMELMDINSTNDTPPYYLGDLGEPLWYPDTVFAYYSPDYVIPGTTINSPESQLLTTTLIVQRSQFLWGMIDGPQSGFEPWGTTWLSQTFPTVPALVDALNHIAYHGAMSAFEQNAITTYCSGLPTQQAQLHCTLLLALSGNSYTVVH